MVSAVRANQKFDTSVRSYQHMHLVDGVYVAHLAAREQFEMLQVGFKNGAVVHAVSRSVRRGIITPLPRDFFIPA
jgi:hypothetical protein